MLLPKLNPKTPPPFYHSFPSPLEILRIPYGEGRHFTRRPLTLHHPPFVLLLIKLTAAEATAQDRKSTACVFRHIHRTNDPRDHHSPISSLCLLLCTEIKPFALFTRQVIKPAGLACEQELSFLLQRSANCGYRRATRPPRPRYDD